MPDDVIESLVVFEGALAWETGASRSALPPVGVDWAKDAWLSGWDWADQGYGHRAVTPLEVETHSV